MKKLFFTVLIVFSTSAAAADNVIDLSTLPICENNQHASQTDPSSKEAADHIKSIDKQKRLLNTVAEFIKYCKESGDPQPRGASKKDLDSGFAQVACTFPPKDGGLFESFDIRIFSFAKDGHLLMKSLRDDNCANVVWFETEESLLDN